MKDGCVEGGGGAMSKPAEDGWDGGEEAAAATGLSRAGSTFGLGAELEEGSTVVLEW